MLVLSFSWRCFVAILVVFLVMEVQTATNADEILPREDINYSVQDSIYRAVLEYISTSDRWREYGSEISPFIVVNVKGSERQKYYYYDTVSLSDTLEEKYSRSSIYDPMILTFKGIIFGTDRTRAHVLLDLRVPYMCTVYSYMITVEKRYGIWLVVDERVLGYGHWFELKLPQNGHY